MKKNEFGDMVRGGLWGYAKNVCGVDLSQELAHKAVRIFRETYPEVVHLWTDLEEAFKQVLLRGGTIPVGKVTWDSQQREWVPNSTNLGCVLTFRRIAMAEGGYTIQMVLPSGRALHYLNATIEEEGRISKRTGRPYTVQALYYEGIEHSESQEGGQVKKKQHKWGRVRTSGGKLVENADQAIARDIFQHGMKLADELGFHIWGLYHDELATEVDDDLLGLGLMDLIWCMSEVPAWAPGLLLGAEGYESQYYRKG